MSGRRLGVGRADEEEVGEFEGGVEGGVAAAVVSVVARPSDP